jgi:hypothetical protein
MKKVLYHGSGKAFGEFVIDKALARSSEKDLTQGYGIYMSEDYEFCKSYGNNVYTTSVDEKNIFDTLSKKAVRSIIKKVEKMVDVHILNNIDLDTIFKKISSGEITVNDLYVELNDILESNEKFYFEHENLFTDDDDCLTKRIEEAYKMVIPDVIKFHNKFLGMDMYVCVKNEENLKIENIDTEKRAS